RPNGCRKCSNRQSCIHQGLVTEDWFTAEDWEDFRNNSEERQCNNVHLWVYEEPEEVLPEHCSAFTGVGVRAEDTVTGESKHCCCKNREDHQHQDRGNQRVPGEDWHTPHGHTGCAHGDNRGDKVHRTENGTETTECKTKDP